MADKSWEEVAINNILNKKDDRKKNISVRLSEEMIERLDQFRNEVSRGLVVEAVISAFLDEAKRKKWKIK